MNTKKIHVMSNTHWDREHRHGFQETRIMLVELIDQLIEIMENDPDYKYFTFDGQAIVIDDYLEVKPFMKERLGKLIKEGRILIGPWYSLVDCNSANGESIIRNILKGHKYCEEYGGAMKLGYSIFSFGQIAQMPQIYAGFDIDTILFYKNPSREIMPNSEFFWVAPDGTKALATRLGRYNRWNFFFHFSIPVVLGGDARIPGWQAKFNASGKLCHMVDDNYVNQFAQELEQDIRIREDKIIDSVNDVLDSVDESLSKNVFLAFEGTDFTSPLKCMPAAIKRANELMEGDVELVYSNPVEYIKELKKDIDLSSLISYSGEMRFGPISSVHSEVMAANVELKQAMFQAENTLLFYAEPFMVIGSQLGYKYPKEILDKAWKYIFEVYTHDSIHGSGVPKLKSDNAYGLAQAQEIGESVTRRAIENLAREINMDHLEKESIHLVVFNPTPYERSEVMRVHVDIPKEDLVKDIWIEEMNGERVEAYKHSKKSFHLACVNMPNRPKTVYSDRIDMDVFVKDIPAYGYKTMKVKIGKGDPAQYQPFTPVGIFPHAPIGKSGNILDNGLVRATINANGSVDLLDYETGITHREINVFTDSGCCGSMWAHKTPDDNKIISSKGLSSEIALIRNSFVSATYSVKMVMNIPQSLEVDRRSRKKTILQTEITSEITLAKGLKRLDFKTYFTNTCKDHMLTVRIPVGVKADYSYSEAPFEVRKRPIGTTGNENGVVDDRNNLTRCVMHNFVDVSDGVGGLAVLCKGLKECEVAKEDSPVVILTLLRAVSNSIPIHDDLYVDFEEEPSQCLGNQCFEYSVQLHAKDWFEGKVIPFSRRYNLPLVAVQIGKGTGGKLPLQNGFIALKKSNLVLSGIKQAEDGNGIILRLFNPSDRSVTETVEITMGFEAVYLTNMNEEVLEEVKNMEGNKIRLDVTPFKIVTLKIEQKGV